MKIKSVKTPLSLMVIGIFLFLAYGSDESKPEEKKTNFATCDELVEYTRYKSYSTLAKEWGEGEVGELWNSYSSDENPLEVSVKWTNIRCNGKAVEISYHYEGYPSQYSGILCSDYE